MIDWQGSFAGENLKGSVLSGTKKNAAKNWTADFVKGLGQPAKRTDPNAALRIHL